MEAIKNTHSSDRNAFLYKYSPYWPLFTILIILMGVGAFLYLKYVARPTYAISANILVVDEKKGADDSPFMQAMNISSNTIVDNETELLRSKELLKSVIDSLRLYAPISEEDHVISRSAYLTSPVIIRVQNPERIQETEPVSFSYNATKKTVDFGNQSYPLGDWVKTPVGILKFSKNPRLENPATGNLHFVLQHPRKVLDDLANKISISPTNKLSSVINVSMKDEVPERGENILNALIKVYYKKSLNDKSLLATTTLSFVEERIAKVASQLDSIENSMKNLKNRKGIIDLSEQGKLYLSSVSDNDRTMTDIDMKLAMLGEVEKYVASNDAEKIGIVPSLSAMSDQRFLSQLLEKLYNDQMQYQRLIKTVPAGNPSMYSLKNEIDKARPSILENIQNERKSLEASKNRLGASSGSYRSMLASIPQKEQALLEVSRQQAIKNDAYAFLLQKREEAALAHAAMVTNSRTINEATASFEPVSPKKAFVYLSALAIALLLGFAIVYAKEMLTNRVLFRSDIEKLTDRPVVAEIISIGKKQREELFDGNDQVSSAEQFIQLRAAMRIINKDIKHRKILITSGVKGEGKSFIANSLAISLLHSGKKVVILDFDIRHPKTTFRYNLADKKGLAEYLETGDLTIDEIIYPTNKNNLFVIPAGNTSINAAELLINKDLTNLFEHLENKFDFVLIDSCPLDPFIDATIISDYCDATLFVIRHGYTQKTMLESLTKSQKTSSIHNMFIVFNGVKPRGFIKHNYGPGYGYGFNKMYPDKYYQMQRVAGKA